MRFSVHVHPAPQATRGYRKIALAFAIAIQNMRQRAGRKRGQENAPARINREKMQVAETMGCNNGAVALTWRKGQSRGQVD